MYFFEGALLIFALAAVLSRTKLWKRVLTLAACATVFILMWGLNGIHHRSGSEWWQQEGWRNAILFVLMLAGMIFRVAWDALEEYRARRAANQAPDLPLRPRFDRWDFLYPGLASLIVFQSVLWVAKSQDLSWELAVTSFQNGFFWNALLSRSRAAVEQQGKLPAVPGGAQ